MATKRSHRLVYGRNDVQGIAPSVLMGTSSNLQVSRRGIMSHSSSNLGKVASSGLVHPRYNIKITKNSLLTKTKK